MPLWLQITLGVAAALVWFLLHFALLARVFIAERRLDERHRAFGDVKAEVTSLAGEVVGVKQIVNRALQRFVKWEAADAGGNGSQTPAQVTEDTEITDGWETGAPQDEDSEMSGIEERAMLLED